MQTTRRYTEVANNVQQQETILNIQFNLLDSSPLKNAILGHCLEWQGKFTKLLYEIATARLSELTDFLKNNAERSGTRIYQPIYSSIRGPEDSRAGCTCIALSVG